MIALAPLALLAILAPLFVRATAHPQSTFNVSCMQAAVDKRDSTMAAAAKSTYGSSLSVAFTVRKNALKAAWDISARKDRQAAINATWKTFSSQKAAAKSYRKAAAKSYRASRWSAWLVYEAMSGACGIGAAQDDTHGPGSDAISQ